MRTEPVTVGAYRCGRNEQATHRRIAEHVDTLTPLVRLEKVVPFVADPERYLCEPRVFVVGGLNVVERVDTGHSASGVRVDKNAADFAQVQPFAQFAGLVLSDDAMPDAVAREGE